MRSQASLHISHATVDNNPQAPQFRDMQKFLCQLDALVPFAPILRRVRHVGVSGLYSDILLTALPLTLVFLAISAQIPVFGIAIYILGFIPLVVLHHNRVNGAQTLQIKAQNLVWYFSVIFVGTDSAWLAIVGAMEHQGWRVVMYAAFAIAGLASIARPNIAPWLVGVFSVVLLDTATAPVDYVVVIFMLCAVLISRLNLHTSRPT